MKQLFKIDRSSPRALLALEWMVLAYMAFTIILIFFTYTTHEAPLTLIGGRLQILAMMGGLWLVHRMLPCLFTLYLRVMLQAALLSWWYPDTYELNKVLPNLDPVFASVDQSIFGCQPALLLHTILPSWMSEPLHMGYSSYYLFIAVTLIYYLFWQREDFLRASFVLLTSFFAFYVIFDLIPVTGPIYYYEFAGIENIRDGLFPDAGDHFMNSQACLTMPGNQDGFFYHLVENAHHAGERPTAAFPSSHVGCCAVMELLLLFSKKWKLSLFLLPFFILMSIATVYIQAHYAIDAIVGLFVGASFYFIFNTIYKKAHLW